MGDLPRLQQPAHGECQPAIGAEQGVVGQVQLRHRAGPQSLWRHIGEATGAPALWVNMADGLLIQDNRASTASEDLTR